LFFVIDLKGEDMKKICIVFANAPRHMIMANIYFEYLKENMIPYDVIYLNKYDEYEYTGAENNYPINYKKKNIMQKVLGHLKFGREASKILRQNEYGFVIVWGEYTASFISKTLIKDYSQRYCINVRDLNVGLRKILDLSLNKAIKSARFTTVSSEKYLDELTKDYNHYLFFHSYNQKIMDETLAASKDSLNKNTITPIRILFIGNIRFYDHLERFINLIKNDNRFEMIVAGSGSEKIQTFVKEYDIKNVKTYGAFPKEKTGAFLCNADVIYNLYGIEDINLRYALSNKLYYAVSLRLPILVYKNTYMYEMADKCDIAFAVDDYVNGEFADAFYNWYVDRDTVTIERKCSELINSAIESQNMLRDEMNSVKNELL